MVQKITFLGGLLPKSLLLLLSSFLIYVFMPLSTEARKCDLFARHSGKIDASYLPFSRTRWAKAIYRNRRGDR
jgi:hypothetical protein